MCYLMSSVAFAAKAFLLIPSLRLRSTVVYFVFGLLAAVAYQMCINLQLKTAPSKCTVHPCLHKEGEKL